MILPDINLLVYAYNADAPMHGRARRWWEGLLNNRRPVGIPWLISHGFIRIMTHPRALQRPLPVSDALRHVRSWIEWPSVQIPEPGPRHFEILQALLEDVSTGGNLVTDASLAALAIEYQCEVHSNDADFSRFKGLRWRNPLR